MKIAFNPSTVAALIAPPNNKDITFDLRGHNIFARGVKFCGTDTNTWRDIKINNVSIDSNTLDLRDGSNTTLTNINGVVTINSTWRPVVDNLTSDSTTSSLSANQGRVLVGLINGKSDSEHNHDDRYYTKAESNAKYITDITTSVNKLTFTKNGSNIDKDIKVNVVYSQGNLTNISDKNATTKASSGLFIYNSYNQVIGTNSYSSVLSINTGGTIQIAGNWGDDQSRNLYWRSQSDRDVSSYPWKSWRTILDSENYSSILDSRYYTESEVDNLLDAKLNRQNLSYGTWNPRGYNLAADYSYNGGDLSISESEGKIHISVDGYFWQNEGQYRVLDTSDVAGFLRWKGMQNIGNNAPFQAVVDIIKDTSKLNDGGLSFYSYAGDEYTVLIGSRNDATRHGNALKWGYANKYLWMIRMINGSPKSSDWEKISAGYADSAGSASNLTVHQYLSNTDTTWWPLIWGGSSHNNTSDSTGEVYKSHDVLSWQTSSQTLYATHLRTTYIDLKNSRGISQVTSGGTSPYKGIKLPDLQSNGIGIFSRVGNSTDEGGIILSEDTCVIYNSFDAGWGLSVRDKDLNQTDISSDDTVAFGIRQNYKLYSRGGFEKKDSSDNYVLLGGGGHQTISSLSVNYANSAGNADTVDGEHAYSFVRAGHYESADLNKLDTYSFIRSVNSNNNSTSPKGDTGWYNVIQLVHRNGSGDGPGYIGQIALGMTTNTNDMFFRGKRTDPWKTVIHSGNYTEFINNYYWANVKISTSSSTTTSPTVYTLTATNSIRMGNILLEHTDEINNSANGGIHLNYRNSGNITLCYGGGNVGIETPSPTYKLDVNGQVRASGFRHSSVNSDNYMLLAGGGYKSFGGNYDNPIFLGYLNLDHGSDGTVSSSFYCLGYSVPFTYTRGGNYCRISIPDTSYQVFYIRAAIASVNYSGGGMDTWTGNRRGDGAWWLHCYASSSNEVRVKGFRQNDTNNDSWWGGNPLIPDSGGANRITVCIFGYVSFR